MRTKAMGLAVLLAVAALVAACGSSAPNVSGAAASDSTTLFKASNLTKVLSQAKSDLGGSGGGEHTEDRATGRQDRRPNQVPDRR